MSTQVPQPHLGPDLPPGNVQDGFSEVAGLRDAVYDTSSDLGRWALGGFVRVVAMVIAGLALVLAGCGGATASSSPPTASPSPGPSRATVRALTTGERVTLACGLSLTVPAGYNGSLFVNAPSDPSDSGTLDGVASGYLAQSSLMHSFAITSLTESATLSPGMKPLLARWNNGAFEVHGFVVRRGTPRDTSVISMIVHLPGKPRGRVSLMVVGKHASDAPEVILEQAKAMWKLFKVQGALLPSTS